MFFTRARRVPKQNCFLLAATADLPARSLLCNSVQYNGKFGCWKCSQPGETAPVRKGHTHVFPFQKDPMGPVRTAESVKQNSVQALRNLREKVKNPAVYGVKGPSWISYFPHFDCVHCNRLYAWCIARSSKITFDTMVLSKAQKPRFQYFMQVRQAELLSGKYPPNLGHYKVTKTHH